MTETADALSRDCIDTEKGETEEELEVQIVLSMTETALEKFTTETKNDEELQSVIRYIQDGWPEEKEDVEEKARRYFNFRDELAYYEGLIFKGDKIVAPKTLISNMLQQIHQGQVTQI
ncbi:hypothetical protein QE152_g5781 [Popillia japonica]|uniref:Uncharacterized protein n=1 Tax=Popillia japonica TaxID=7064 RepID=A0AAW1MKZ9_POPJA